jgi:hypothetical protein
MKITTLEKMLQEIKILNSLFSIVIHFNNHLCIVCCTKENLQHLFKNTTQLCFLIFNNYNVLSQKITIIFHIFFFFH